MIVNRIEVVKPPFFLRPPYKNLHSTSTASFPKTLPSCRLCLTNDPQNASNHSLADCSFISDAERQTFRQANVSQNQEDESVPCDYGGEEGFVEPSQEDWPLQYEDQYSQHNDQGHSMSMRIVRVRKINTHKPPALAAFPTVHQRVWNSEQEGGRDADLQKGAGQV